ncbi:MAG: DUF6838 family protein [Anaerotignum faecicola]
MTEEIRRAVIQAIAVRFQLPVYGQRVPQGAKKPCFTVELKETEQKRLLGRRAARKAVFEVTYYCGEEKAAAAECAEALDGCMRLFASSGERNALRQAVCRRKGQRRASDLRRNMNIM